MKVFLITVLFNMNVFASEQCLPITNPSFTAESVELNPVTKKYMVY